MTADEAKYSRQKSAAGFYDTMKGDIPADSHPQIKPMKKNSNQRSLPAIMPKPKAVSKPLKLLAPAYVPPRRPGPVPKDKPGIDPRIVDHAKRTLSRIEELIVQWQVEALLCQDKEGGKIRARQKRKCAAELTYVAMLHKKAIRRYGGEYGKLD